MADDLTMTERNKREVIYSSTHRPIQDGAGSGNPNHSPASELAGCFFCVLYSQ